MPVLLPSSSVAQVSEQDYLALEKNSDSRHELVDGQVLAMAGSSKRHNTIAGNIFAHCHTALRASPCRVYSSDIKVRINHRKNYYYPDLVVGCEEADNHDYYLEQPYLIVEVLSDSTEKRDRTEKLLSYINIPSLQGYLLVSQDKPEADLVFRSGDGTWSVKCFEGLNASVLLPCLQTELSLAEIYAGIFAA